MLCEVLVCDEEATGRNEERDRGRERKKGKTVETLFFFFKVPFLPSDRKCNRNQLEMASSRLQQCSISTAFCTNYKGRSLRTIMPSVHKTALVSYSYVTGSGSSLRQIRMHIYQPVYVYALPWLFLPLCLMCCHKLENWITEQQKRM